MDMETFIPANEDEAKEMNSEVATGQETGKTPAEIKMNEDIEHYKLFDDSLIPSDVLEAMRKKGLRQQ